MSTAGAAGLGDEHFTARIQTLSAALSLNGFKSVLTACNDKVAPHFLGASCKDEAIRMAVAEGMCIPTVSGAKCQACIYTDNRKLTGDPNVLLANWLKSPQPKTRAALIKWQKAGEAVM